MIKRPILIVAVLLGGLGLIVSRPQLLQFLNAQDPIVDFLIWYVLLFVYLQIASLALFRRIDTTTFRYSFGAIILYFAAGVVFYWPASQYALNTVGASPVGMAGTPAFLLASEDQVTYSFWHFLLPFMGNDILGILTYVFTPVILVLLVALFIAPKQLTAALRGLLRPL